MVDINNKSKCCSEENCLKRANFNFDSETKGIQCTQHKKEDMIDLNLKHKIKCVEGNCLKQPCFNFDSETKRIQCAQHKKEGMVQKTKIICI